MARKYSVNSGLTSIANSITKVLAQIATPSTSDCTVIAFEVTFDGPPPSGSTNAPAKLELVRTTAASSGGSTATPAKWMKDRAAAQSTARINDTSDGTSPTVLKGWEIPSGGGYADKFPLGREFELGVSDFWELRLVTPSGWTTQNYEANIDIEE